MNTGWEVAVLIPARNEEALLTRCLESVIGAIDFLPRTIKGSIVLVSDSSTDCTADIARRLIGSRGYVLHAETGVVGTARALAATCALHTTSNSPSRIWLANTDADCVVPPAWLCHQIQLAERGVEAIAGIVSVDSFAEHGPEVPLRFRQSYTIYEDGTHPHIHGANLGVRADRYVDVGGWADLKTAEDHDLWGRLRKSEARLISCADLEVVTSGRRVGRAPHGFANALSAHNDQAFRA